MLEIAKFDSLRLRLPYNEVECIDTTIEEKYCKYYPKTGEISKEEEIDLVKWSENNGIKTKISIANLINEGILEKVFVLLINAKQLKERYFEGITINNLPSVYNYLIGLNIIHFTYKTFLNGCISDIDICYDVNVKVSTMINSNREIYNNVKPSCARLVRPPFKRKDNTGLNFNERNKATPSKPHIKIYHKTCELNTRSLDFAKAYLKDINFENIGRLEFTVKNRAHFKYLGLYPKTLMDLLEIKQTKLQDIVFSGILKYIDTNGHIKDYSKLTPSETLLLKVIELAKDKGATNENFYSLLNVFECRTKKNRAKKLLCKILFEDREKRALETSLENQAFFEKLKLNLKPLIPEQ
tara:strand:- start:383 stop:1444 length:1062 start_codon:yes stop_codon:yes gene_type:complete